MIVMSELEKVEEEDGEAGLLEIWTSYVFVSWKFASRVEPVF